MRRLLVLALGLLGCGGSRQARPLEPRVDRLKQIAAAAPAAPSAERMAELKELLEPAFVPGAGSTQLARMAKRSLLEAEDAFWVLEAALDHPEPGVRSNAAYELGRIGRQASILPLLRQLKYERKPEVLVWIVSALAALGNHAGLSELITLMRRGETASLAVARAIEIVKAEALGASPAYAELETRLGKLHRRWLETGIAGSGKQQSEPTPLTKARIVQHLLKLEGFQLRQVDEARYVLARAGRLPLALLGEALGASETYLRLHALEIASDLGRVAAPLSRHVLPLLDDPLANAEAARALGNMRAREALPGLLRALEKGDADLRAAAAGALGPLGDRAAIPPLKAILADEQESMDIRVRAAFSLAIFELHRPARAFLLERRTKGDYHTPTIDELLDRIEKHR